jgi:hypothetical protein
MRNYLPCHFGEKKERKNKDRAYSGKPPPFGVMKGVLVRVTIQIPYPSSRGHLTSVPHHVGCSLADLELVKLKRVWLLKLTGLGAGEGAGAGVDVGAGAGAGAGAGVSCFDFSDDIGRECYMRINPCCRGRKTRVRMKDERVILRASKISWK